MFSHGIKAPTAKVELRSQNIINIQVQFNLIDLLNYKSKNYSLMAVAALPKAKFEKLYQEVIKLFNRSFTVKRAEKIIELNKRYPSSEQVYQLIQREFIEKKVTASDKHIPYTFSERRFYQLFNFDIRLKTIGDIKNVNISFPKELGDVYVTYSNSKTMELHTGETWFME